MLGETFRERVRVRETAEYPAARKRNGKNNTTRSRDDNYGLRRKHPLFRYGLDEWFRQQFHALDDPVRVDRRRIRFFEQHLFVQMAVGRRHVHEQLRKNKSRYKLVYSCCIRPSLGSGREAPSRYFYTFFFLHFPPPAIKQ